MTTTNPEIKIKDVGPIEAVSIPIPEGGGVVVLRGGNGAGKSTALDAIDTMARGSTALAARARHGTTKGVVEGLGASVTVGLARSTRKGELQVEAFGSRVDVARLVDPGIKDPERADAARIATACALAEIQPDPERFRALVDVELDESIFEGDDLLTVATRVRSELQRVAREAETYATEQTARATALREAAGSGEDVPPVAEAQAGLEDAIAAHAGLVARAKSAGEAAGRAEAARKRLAALDSDPVDVTAALAAEVDADSHLYGCRERLDDLRRQLADAEREVDDAVAAHNLAVARLQAAQQNAADRAAARLALDEATAAEAAPTPDEIAAAAQAVDAARSTVARAAVAEKAAEKRAEAGSAEAEAREATRRAQEIRAAAGLTDRVLAEHLAAVMPQGLIVRDGRLVVQRGNREVPFGELSEGERWRVALDIAIGAMGTHGLVAIPQDAWEGLDGNARRMVAAHARERGVVIVTAECDHDQVGGLRAEVFGGGGV